MLNLFGYKSIYSINFTVFINNLDLRIIQMNKRESLKRFSKEPNIAIILNNKYN